MQTKSNTGKQYQLEQDLVGGGEARIWSVYGHPALVAKIYHKATLQHEAKLKAMVANPPMQPKTHVAIAWPTELLYQSSKFVGFLMPNVQGSSPIYNFYNPAKRRQFVSGFTWRYLHRTALNLVIAAESVHAKGHVVGDINESNILVNGNALVTFVDTDSFQIADGARKSYRCVVGKPEYTPPELQKVNFKEIDRTELHDRFGLAVLIFQLLMEGRHPFAGVLTSPMSVGRVELHCIKEGFFPHHKNGSVTPPRYAPSFKILSPELQDAFVRCFVNGHYSPTRRPKFRDWREVLERSSDH